MKYIWLVAIREYAENARIGCNACNKDFPIPEGMPVDMESDY